MCVCLLSSNIDCPAQIGLCAIFLYSRWIHSFPLDIVLTDGVIAQRCCACYRLTNRRRAWKVAVSTVSSCSCHKLVFVLLCPYFTQRVVFFVNGEQGIVAQNQNVHCWVQISQQQLSNRLIEWEALQESLAFVLNFGTVASCFGTFLFWVLQRRVCLAENNTWLVYTSDTVLEPEWTKQTLI